ncbi:MAG TPA: hypothetical protein VF187_08625 [Gemmatimonadales bacterium]
MRTPLLLLLLVAGAACGGERPASGAANAREASDCDDRVRRSRRDATDSLFVDARDLVARCPDAMTAALVSLWHSPEIPPNGAHHLRGVSAVIRDARLASAIQAVVRDPARPVVTRIEALSTLSYYVEDGKWVEFVFIGDRPDSASLRFFAGSTEAPIVVRGAEPLPSDYEAGLHSLLESLRDTDTASAIRGAARRYILLLDARPHPAPAP